DRRIRDLELIEVRERSRLLIPPGIDADELHARAVRLRKRFERPLLAATRSAPGAPEVNDADLSRQDLRRDRVVAAKRPSDEGRGRLALGHRDRDRVETVRDPDTEISAAPARTCDEHACQRQEGSQRRGEWPDNGRASHLMAT